MRTLPWRLHLPAQDRTRCAALHHRRHGRRRLPRRRRALAGRWRRGLHEARDGGDHAAGAAALRRVGRPGQGGVRRRLVWRCVRAVRRAQLPPRLWKVSAVRTLSARAACDWAGDAGPRGTVRALPCTPNGTEWPLNARPRNRHLAAASWPSPRRCGSPRVASWPTWRRTRARCPSASSWPAARASTRPRATTGATTWTSCCCTTAPRRRASSTKRAAGPGRCAAGSAQQRRVCVGRGARGWCGPSLMATAVHAWGVQGRLRFHVEPEAGHHESFWRWRFSGAMRYLFAHLRDLTPPPPPARSET